MKNYFTNGQIAGKNSNKRADYRGQKLKSKKLQTTGRSRAKIKKKPANNGQTTNNGQNTKQGGDLHRDSSPREWGTPKGHSRGRERSDGGILTGNQTWTNNQYKLKTRPPHTDTPTTYNVATPNLKTGRFSPFFHGRRRKEIFSCPKLLRLDDL